MGCCRHGRLSAIPIESYSMHDRNHAYRLTWTFHVILLLFHFKGNLQVLWTYQAPTNSDGVCVCDDFGLSRPMV